ncbi:FemAB family XrtA/PEP-CTERM system-associated protein [Pelagerythrobacter marensis]|uniref:FemAB family XrtA/PEP-CTERM system-associated protein n=1 Tax=Pelagerythrobacter marensis TaxID=543877 RepID=A0ABZ2D398_9SPHN
MNAPFAMTRTGLALADLNDPPEAARIEAFVADAGGTLFHRPAWLRMVERGTGQRALGIVARRRGTIAGWLPLTRVHSPIFGRALVSSGFAVGGGILAPDSEAANGLAQAAEELACRRSCPTVELRGGAMPGGWDTRSDTHVGFVTALADDDEAQLLAVPRKQRAEVRKSLAGDLSVRVGRGEGDRAAHYAVYAESVRNLGTPVFPRSLFDAALDELDADILTVFHRDAPVASVLSFYHSGTVLPYWGGGTFAARRLRANERMYFELMLHARRRGCMRFDFGRSKTGSGPAAYKKNWGFSPEPLIYATWSMPGSWGRNIDPTDDSYSAKIALWKRLPLELANRIGPPIARGLG